MLNILSNYKLPEDINGSLGVHRELEALKHAFAVRVNLGDPDFVNVRDVLADMVSHKFARALFKTIHDNNTLDPKMYGGR